MNLLIMNKSQKIEQDLINILLSIAIRSFLRLEKNLEYSIFFLENEALIEKYLNLMNSYYSQSQVIADLSLKELELLTKFYQLLNQQEAISKVEYEILQEIECKYDLLRNQGQETDSNPNSLMISFGKLNFGFLNFKLFNAQEFCQVQTNPNFEL